MMLIQCSVNTDWLFNTQSRVLPADWFILEIKEKATLNTKMPYSLIIVRQDGKRTTTMNNCLWVMDKTVCRYRGTYMSHHQPYLLDFPASAASAAIPPVIAKAAREPVAWIPARIVSLSALISASFSSRLASIFFTDITSHMSIQEANKHNTYKHTHHQSV